MRDIDYVDPHDTSDVKVPWETLAAAVADPGGSGVPAHRRGTLRRGRPRSPRRLDRGQPLCPDRQLVLHDGGRASHPELDLVLPGVPCEPRLGRSRLPRALPARSLPARGLHRAPPRTLGRQRQPLHGRCDGSRVRGALLRSGKGPWALADAGLVAALRRDPAAGVSRRRRLRGVRRVPPARSRALPARRALPAGLGARRAAGVSRAPRRDGALRRGLQPARRRNAALGRCGRRARPPAREPAAHRSPLPGGCRRRGFRRSGAARRLRREPRRSLLAARARGRGDTTRRRDATPATALHRLSRRRLLRHAQRGRSRLHRLRPRRARRPRRPRPQRLPLLRGGARRRPPRHRLRGVRLHRLVRRAEPLPLDRVSQHAARRRRGNEPHRADAALGRSSTTHGPSCGLSSLVPSRTASAGLMPATGASPSR